MGTAGFSGFHRAGDASVRSMLPGLQEYSDKFLSDASAAEVAVMILDDGATAAVLKTSYVRYGERT